MSLAKRGGEGEWRPYLELLIKVLEGQRFVRAMGDAQRGSKDQHEQQEPVQAGPGSRHDGQFGVRIGNNNELNMTAAAGEFNSGKMGGSSRDRGRVFLARCPYKFWDRVATSNGEGMHGARGKLGT